MKRSIAFGGAALLLAALSCGAFAKGTSPVQQEMTTAQTHALMAAHATSISMVHEHLHHVINCLVGPKGTGFDAAAENPCKGMGNGALADAGKNTALHQNLERALMTAQVGVKSDKLPTAQQAAQKTADILQSARDSGD